eukprot:127400_1
MGTMFGLVVYCVIQYMYKPFKFAYANHFELYLLISTITMIGLDNHYRSTPSNIYGVVFMSMLMLFPIFWVIYFVVSRAPAFQVLIVMLLHLLRLIDQCLYLII